MRFQWVVPGRPWLLVIPLAIALLAACSGGEEAPPSGTPNLIQTPAASGPDASPATTPSATQRPPSLAISSISPDPASAGAEVTITFKTDPRAVIGFQITDPQGKVAIQAMAVADSAGTAIYKYVVAGPAGTWRVQAAAGRSTADLLALQQATPGPTRPPGTGSISLEGNYGAQATAGATGARTATASSDDDTGNAHALALRPASASAAISFRAAASAGTPSGGSLTLTIDKPSGTVAGDVMIASIALRPHTAAVTAPAGWTLVRRIDNENPNANSLAVYYKVAGASEPAHYAWSFSSPTSAAGGIQAFSGVDAAKPIDVEGGQITAAKDVVHTAPSLTTTVAGAMLVTSHAFSSAASWTPPSGMTEAYEAVTEGGSQTGSASARFEVR